MKDSDDFAQEMDQLRKEVGRFVLELLETNKRDLADSLASDISARMAGTLKADFTHEDRRLIDTLVAELKRNRQSPPMNPASSVSTSASVEPQASSRQPMEEAEESAPARSGTSLRSTGNSRDARESFEGKPDPRRTELFDPDEGKGIPSHWMIAGAAVFTVMAAVVFWLIFAHPFEKRPSVETTADDTPGFSQTGELGVAAAVEWQVIVNTVLNLPEAEQAAAYRLLCGSASAAACEYEDRREAVEQDDEALELAARLRVLADCSDPQAERPPSRLDLACIVGPAQ